MYRPTPTAKRKDKPKGSKLTVNIENCGYASVERCLRAMDFKITGDKYYNLLYWCDTMVSHDFPLTLQKWQFMNHFPGTFSISKKIDLARNIERMQKVFSELYTFHPKSFIVPSQSLDLKMYLSKCGRPKTFIIKPDLGSQGRGIFLVQDPDGVDECVEPAIAQEYISPYLIDGLKFDLRIYVLVSSVDPLRLYIFDEGMARFCTEPYEKPNSENLTEIYRHLTNYSVNKHNDHFKQNQKVEGTDSQSHKRSKTSVFAQIEACGGDTVDLQNQIDEIITLTLLSVQPFLAHNYRTIFKAEDKKSRCFEILGFDILIDEDLKPWVLEVNHSPSLSCDSPFDTELKDSVICGALEICNIDPDFIEKIQKHERQKTLQRLRSNLNPSATATTTITMSENGNQNRNNINSSLSCGDVENNNKMENRDCSSRSSHLSNKRQSSKKNYDEQILYSENEEFSIAKNKTKWRLIYPVKNDQEKAAVYEEVLTKNASMPMGGMDETSASRQRKEAIQQYIHSMEERSSPPKKQKKVAKIVVSKMQNAGAPSPGWPQSHNRPTKSVLLLREAQLSKIKEATQKESMFLFSPEYENYLKLEKNGKMPRAKSPNVQRRLQTANAQRNVTLPLL